MTEIGRRFELAGRAAQAGRFELAAFEVDELSEVLDEELPEAALPKEGPTEGLRALAEAFSKAYPRALREAAKSQDRDRFAEAFARAADACNACHQTSGHGFIEIPRALGASVPDVSPIGARATEPAARSRPDASTHAAPGASASSGSAEPSERAKVHGR